MPFMGATNAYQACFRCLNVLFPEALGSWNVLPYTVQMHMCTLAEGALFLAWGPSYWLLSFCYSLNEPKW